MRGAAIILGVILCSGAMPQEPAPVKLGLWDVTVRTKAFFPAPMTAAMKKNGWTGGPTFPIETINPPETQRFHKCMDEAERRNGYEGMRKAPRSCVFTHWSEDARSISSGLKCSGSGISMVEETRVSWNLERIHLAMDWSVTYPGIIGEGKSSYEVTSRFLISDCGSIPKGASVPAK